MKGFRIKMNKKIPVLFFTILFSPFFFSATASATNGICTLDPGTHDFNADFGNISAQRNLPIGSLLAVKDFAYGQLLANCSGGDYDASIELMPTFANGNSTIINGDNVYQTTILGVGFAARVDDQPINRTLLLTQNKEKALSPKITIKLYKTGNIVSDHLPIGQILNYKLATSTGLTQAASYNLTSGSVTQSACEITGATAIPVEMGELTTDTMHGKDSTSNPVGITIPLNCDSGTNVNISFSATSSLGDGIIDLADGGAQGIGIKLMYDKNPIKFGQSFYVAQSQTNGTFSIPLTAAYIQTDSIIKPGDASAVANFTITYN